MKIRSAVIVLILGALAPFGSLIWTAPAAWAVSGCGTNGEFRTWAAFHWTRAANDVSGVRAPIQKRTDGDLCDNGSVPQGDNNSSVWIALEDATLGSNSINQAGMIHMQLSNGNHTWCRFYAGGSGAVAQYDCGSNSNDAYVWFTIHPTPSGLHYQIDDCGTSGGYSNCTTKWNNNAVYANPIGATDTETPLGCEIHEMGSISDQQNVGISNYNVQGLANDGWAARQWGDQGVFNVLGPSPCDSLYNHSEQNSGQTMKFNDGRNNT